MIISIFVSVRINEIKNGTSNDETETHLAQLNEIIAPKFFSQYFAVFRSINFYTCDIMLYISTNKSDRNHYILYCFLGLISLLAQSDGCRIAPPPPYGLR
jgi:hypothetical protein